MERKKLRYLIIILLLSFILGVYYLNKKIQVPEERYSAGGIIVKIEEKLISIERSYTTSNGEIKKETIKVRITDQTKITKFTLTDLSELGIPEEEIGETTEEYFPKEETIRLEDLKIGDNIEAMSENNIIGLKEFTAIKVEAFPSQE